VALRLQWLSDFRAAAGLYRAARLAEISELATMHIR
jgi:hypothetical protein